MEILLPRMKYTHEIVGAHGGALLPERVPGVCSGSKIPRVYRPLPPFFFLLGLIRSFRYRCKSCIHERHYLGDIRGGRK